MPLTITPEDSESELLGKLVSDLQSDISIVEGTNEEPGSISGTLHYVSDYEGFSGEAEEQSGNYLALKIDTNDNDNETEIEVELLGGKKGPVMLDEDKNIVIKITNPKTQTILVTAISDEEEVVKEYELTTLLLEETK